jgi:putative heme-binding domain-containing protein
MKTSSRFHRAPCWRQLLLTAVFGVASWTQVQARQDSPFELRAGDRVALIGDTLIEREQAYGYFETRMTAQFQDRNVTFRNLGWSGDTPQGISRASFDFDKPGKAFEKLKEQVAAVRPTVVILGYGMASSFDGEKGLPQFKTGLLKLMDAIKASSTNEVRFLVLSPIRHEDLGAPWPNPAQHNQHLAQYTQVLREIAEQRNCQFVSLFDLFPKKSRGRPLTDNGIHLSSPGYQWLAETVANALHWPTVRKRIDTEALRQAILRKNQLFFDRWRPQNETYLFGFRKHEQGQNAKEIPEFDPLIAEQEKEIARLRQPTAGQASRLSRTPASESGEKPFTSQSKPQPVPNFEIAPGFEVNLYAENPLLAKPIQMNFDPQGRLWIASSTVYPQILPGQIADDKILVLEDTNGDGYAEKSAVFADGLLIPSGVIPGDGGCYVGQSTELLHFKDTNRDGKADQKRTVLSGLGTEDTHHMIHTLRWGPDSALYFNQSIYIHTHFETPHGVVRLNSGGVWQMRPRDLRMNILLRGFCNPWGHDFDQFGQSFETDGAGFQGISWGIPGATYFTYAEMRREMKSISPGNYPKFCGLELVRSQHFPDDWQGNAVTCDFRAHRVVRFSITEQGAGYVTKEMPDLLRTTNVTFRPIDVKLGPDGALYIADWSNPIIQHGEVDFRDPRRDHEHGRIWRVTAKGRPLTPKINFVKASNRELLDTLLSPNAFQQSQARRVLAERGVSIERDLKKWTAAQKTEVGLLQALWMQQAIDRVDSNLLTRVLNATDPNIRAAAVRVASQSSAGVSPAADRKRDASSLAGGTPALLSLLAPRIADEYPRVRVEAMRALARIPSARSAELVLSALDKPMDDFLDYAAWLSINDLAEPWLAALKSGEWKPEGRERQLEFALKALRPNLASEALAVVLKDRKLPRDGSGPWIELIGKAGGTRELTTLFQQVVSGGLDEAATSRGLAALNDAAKSRDMRPSNNLEAIGPLLDSSNISVRQQTARLAGNWKLSQFIPRLLDIASNGSLPPGLRQAAFESLRAVGGKESIAGLRTLTSSNLDFRVRREAVLALAGLDLEQAKEPAVQLLLDTKEETQALALWRALLGIKGAAAALTQALPKTGLPPLVAKAGLRAAREGGRNEPDLVWALTRGADLETAEQSLSPQEIQQLAATAAKDGDPARGEKVFRRKELACVTCHAIGGVGGKVGPDMTSLGASAQMDYLVESMFYPNRKIKEGYHSVMVETKDGLEYSGTVASENPDELVLRDATNKEVKIAKNNIEKRATGNSIMPSGLLDLLQPAERLDLLRFLSELGKPGPYDASKGNVARFWRLAPLTVEAEQSGDEKIVSSSLTDSHWKPAGTLVDGRLTKDELNASLADFKYRTPTAVFAATRLQVPNAGTVRLKLSGVSGAPLWVDGKPVSTRRDATAELSAGTHTVVIKLDTQHLPEAIRLECPDGTFLTN